VGALSGLFEFVQWIDYCYGANYTERKFSEEAVPAEKVAVDERKIREQQSLLEQKDSEIEALRANVSAMSAEYTSGKEEHQESRRFEPLDISEFLTRKKYIDVDLKILGWNFGDDCREEVEVADMAGAKGQPGFADYVLYGKDGLPLAVIEAKRQAVTPKSAGSRQNSMRRSGTSIRRRPMIFITNGFETYFWDDTSYPPRRVSGVFSKDDLHKLMDRRDIARSSMRSSSTTGSPTAITRRGHPRRLRPRV
jgi:type I restriction enzyme R subunit